VLEVLPSLLPGTRTLILTIVDSPYVMYGKPAEKVLSKSVMKKLAAQGENPDDFARDLFWIRLIASQLHNSATIDTRIAEALPLQDAKAWMNPAAPPASARERAAKFAAMMSLPLELLCRVSPDEEAAVASLREEIAATLGQFRFQPRS
jgi:hypothetical protein